MSKNGPTAVRIGFSAADAVKSKVPIVRTRTNGEINLANALAKKPELSSLVEPLRAKRWNDRKIFKWLQENGHLGRFRLTAWLDEEKSKAARPEYAETADALRRIADEAIAKRVYRRARLARFSRKSGIWKKKDRWPSRDQKTAR